MSFFTRRAPSTTSTSSKPRTSLSTSCVIADSAILTGSHLITIMPDAIVQPRAKINATHGAVSVGEGCIICERASIGLVDAEQSGKARATGEVVLGKNITVEIAAVVEARSIGDHTTIEAGAKVGKAAVIGKVGTALSRQY